MGIHIVVFTETKASSKHTNIVQKLLHFGVLVDSVHGTNEHFLKTNYPNARFFFLSDFLSMCLPEELTFVKPDFVISFDEDEEVSDIMWICIERYLESLFLPSIQVRPEVVEKGKQFLSRYCVPAPLAIPSINNTPSLPEHYELYMNHLKDRDTMLIQVEKPYCDLPYTVVINNYSTKGLKSFFTDLFISQSWGVSRKDIEFLAEVWNHWKMEGPFDLDQMLREATQRCFPDNNTQPEPEPIVYRRPIENVIETLAAKDLGIEHQKEQDFWNQQRLKKRQHDDSLLN